MSVLGQNRQPAETVSAEGEQAAAVDAVEHAGTLLQSLVESSYDAIIATTLDRVITIWNPAAERMLGFAAAEAIGRPVSITNVGAEQDAERTEVRRRIISGEALVELDTNLRTKSGQIIDVTLRISPLRDPRGRVVGLSAVVRDTTERKRSERALAEFAAIVESSYDAIIGTGLDGVVTSWNPAAERLYGYSAGEAIGRPLTSLVSSERDAVERAEILRRLAEGEQLVNLEATRHTKGGEGVEVEVTVSTVRDRQGQPVGFGSVVRDITERKRSERAVAQLAAIVESSYDAIIGVTREGVITSWNPAAERLYGYSAGEAIGRTMSSLSPSESHADDLAEVIRRIANGEQVTNLEITRRTKGGELVDVEVTVSPVRDREGRIVGAGSVQRDITERKRNERAVAQLAAIVESSHDAIIGAKLDGVVTSWNPAAERLFGYSPAEAVGRTVESLVGSDDDATASRQDRVRRLLRDEALAPSEGSRMTKHGQMIEVEWMVSPVRDQAGIVIGLSMIARDVTERGRAASALREAQELFRHAFEDAPIGMAILTLDGLYAEVNGAFCQIVGCSAEQLVGASVDSITDPDDVGTERAQRDRLLQGERMTPVIEKRYRHASGGRVDVAVQSTLLRGEGEQPLYFLSQVQDIGVRKRYEERLEYLADHDALTGLLNRRAFHRALDAHATMVKRYEPIGSVLVIDLDHFKFVNDTLGHRTGDELITHAARVLSSRLRSTDVLARLGGDEFGVLLPNASASAAMEVASGLLDALRAQGLRIGGLDRTLTASIGVASFERQPGMDGEDALVQADLAMYDAKEAGRDRVCLFTNDDRAQAHMKSRVTWAQRIQAALQQHRLVLLAQPIMELAGRAVTQYELLLRMSDEQEGLIAPGSFLPIAERLGLIAQIDSWVVTNGLRMLADLGAGESCPALEINLSGASLGDAALLDQIERELRETGIDPARVIFEVTETAALGSIVHARAFGQRLSDIGCQFAIDDFGAGFGSFFYLKHLVYDLIKIDGEFVRNCTASDTDQLLIASIVKIARGLGKRTIAEAVGDEPTIELLAKLGVDYGQGYYLGVPRPLAEYLAASRIA